MLILIIQVRFYVHVSLRIDTKRINLVWFSYFIMHVISDSGKREFV